MNDYLMFLFSFLIIFILVYVGVRIERKLVLSRYYISPPLLAGTLGSIVLILVMWMSGIRWNPEPIVGQLLVTSFLFFVGFKIGTVYTIRHMRSLLLFFLLTTGLLFLLEIISWSQFRERPVFIESFGAMSFAWNDEWLSYTRMHYPDISIIYHTSLLLVFLITPLMIRFMSRKIIQENRPDQPLLSFKWRSIGILMAAAATISASWIKHLWLEQAMFLFDFVLSMGVGIGIGLWFRGKRAQSPLVLSIAESGKYSLYGFVAVMMLTASQEIWLHGNWIIAGLLFVKLFILSVLLLILSRLVVRNHKHLVWASATWAFTLSAPVSCMNAMRTVVDQHGEADDVILIVPPVILWAINYPHYLIFIWLYGTK
jgi:Na+/glutamate symporter